MKVANNKGKTLIEILEDLFKIFNKPETKSEEDKNKEEKEEKQWTRKK